ncbi:MAG: hypothetical protein MUF07_11625 [Steroidobacteraceae bacterium]|jgi:hypothetical protein|nr:hypothetical protein [Steroidobacteraceae bacterium]
MSAQPLSHHEILGLVGPFARAGRHVDLAATQRQERRIAFRPLDLPAAPAADGAAAGQDATAGHGAPALRETLVLESFGTGTFRLTRTLASLDDGLRATVQGLGPDPAVLLAQVLAVEPRTQFRRGAGWSMALSYELYTATAGAIPPVPAAATVPPAEPVLVRGEVRVAGLTLSLSLSAVKGVAGELTLEPGGPARPDLPQDLLAVLGWNWARLVETREGWRSKLRLRGNTLRRSAGAERALERAAVHLAQTLAEPPARFHERWRAARWGVVLRRSLPVLTVISVMVAALLLPRAEIRQRPGLVTLIFHVPIVLIALSFAVQELAQFEIPPLPRRSAAPSWLKAGEDPGRGRPRP